MNNLLRNSLNTNVVHSFCNLDNKLLTWLNTELCLQSTVPELFLTANKEYSDNFFPALQNSNVLRLLQSRRLSFCPHRILILEGSNGKRW